MRTARKRYTALGLVAACGLAAAILAYAILNDNIRPLGVFKYLSWEMSDAPAASTPARRMQAWIFKNRAYIIATAKKYGVSPEAIAGVVAYEGIVDVHPAYVVLFARYSGPGKVHYKEFRLREGEPIAKSVEELGILPKLTMERRRAVLATDQGAIRYIGAILRAQADVARKYGVDIGHDAPALLTFYSAWSLTEEDAFFREGHRAAIVPNAPGHWVAISAPYLLSALYRERSKISTLEYRETKMVARHEPQRSKSTQ